jgi:hypothetical protein
MKKSILLAILILLSFTISAHAVEWTVANQSTIAWDAVTQTVEGKNFPAGDIVKYQIYIVGETADKGTAVKSGGEITALEYTITFDTEGRWLAGVQSIRIPEASPTDIQKSVISWSDSLDVVLVPVPFGFIFFETPAQVGGIGPK